MFRTDKPLTLNDLPRTAPPMQYGDHWKGVSSYELAFQLLSESESYRTSWEPKFDAALTLHTSSDGMSLAVGLMLPGDDPDYSPALAILTSNAQRFGLSGFVGVILNDGTGIPLGSCFHGLRHTKGLDVHEIVTQPLALLRRGWKAIMRMIFRLKIEKVSHAEVCRLIVEAAENEWLPWRSVKHVLLKFRELSGATMWDLLHAYAIIAREGAVFAYRGATNWPGQLQSIHLFHQSLPMKGRKVRIGE